MDIYDIIIVGGGPAGLTAALYALRSGKKVLALEKNGLGGQIALAPRVENFPGTESMSGAEFSDRLFAQVSALGCDIDIDEVVEIKDENGLKRVICGYAQHMCKAVIVATGAKHRRLGLDKEDELGGISYCAVCDGAFYKNKIVAVVGGGDAALQDALLLANTAKTVYVIHRRETFRAEEANIAAARQTRNITFIMNSRVTALVGENELSGLKLCGSDGSETLLGVDGLFVAIGFEPENSAFAPLAKLTDEGWFDSEENCLTATPGLFVAGDCRAKTVRQLTTAVGDGAVAALAACKYINGIPR